MKDSGMKSLDGGNVHLVSQEIQSVDKPPSTASGFVQTFPASSLNARRLLLLSHNRVMWYHYDTQEFQVIHEGEGVYHGVFPGEEVDGEGRPTTIWVVSRPDNWRPKEAEEWLIQLDMETGRELQRKQIDSKFTHDAARHGDRVYVADCGRGGIVELEFPSLRQLRRMDLFTERQHVNTLSPVDGSRLWAMLHNLGPSVLAEVDLESGKVVRRLENIGLKSHGAVQWRDKDTLVILDSDHASIAIVDLRDGSHQTLWTAEEGPKVFLKGLVVVDDIAFFGIAAQQRRQSRGSIDLNCDIAAFDLQNQFLLFRRNLPTHGLLNIVSAPHLQVETPARAAKISDSAFSYRSTFQYAKESASFHADKRSHVKSESLHTDVETMAESMEKPTENADAFVSQHSEGDGGMKAPYKPTLMELEPLPEDDPIAPYPPKLKGHWASGFPRFDLSQKGRGGFSSGVQLLLYREDVSELKRMLLALPDEDWSEEVQRSSNAWLTGREKNLKQFKPNTSAIHLIFSDNAGNNVFEFPWYEERFKDILEPMLRKILGDDIESIIRLQFARMAPHSDIKGHMDRGGYSEDGHRIHIVVATSPNVEFAVCSKSCVPLHVEEGMVFELNNRLHHYVKNQGDSHRIHLVIDVSEEHRTREKLHKGQICSYGERGAILC